MAATSRVASIDLAASVAGAGVVSAAERQQGEPRYLDRPLSSWVQILAGASKDSQRQEAVVAIRSIGANAVPFLLEWIQHEAKPRKGTSAELDKLLSRSPPEWPPGRGPREELVIAADRAFCALQTQALPAH